MTAVATATIAYAVRASARRSSRSADLGSGGAVGLVAVARPRCAVWPWDCVMAVAARAALCAQQLAWPPPLCGSWPWPTRAVHLSRALSPFLHCARLWPGFRCLGWWVGDAQCPSVYDWLKARAKPQRDRALARMSCGSEERRPGARQIDIQIDRQTPLVRVVRAGDALPRPARTP